MLDWMTSHPNTVIYFGLNLLITVGYLTSSNSSKHDALGVIVTMLVATPILIIALLVGMHKTVRDHLNGGTTKSERK